MRFSFVFLCTWAFAAVLGPVSSLACEGCQRRPQGDTFHHLDLGAFKNDHHKS